MAESEPTKQPRSRRTTRQKPVASSSEVVAPTPKKKLQDPEARLEYLLTNARSKLTNIDITDILSYQNFLSLSPESQQALCALLPPTAFNTYEPALDASHPSKRGEVATTHVNLERTPATLDPVFFTNPFLLSSSRTFQDHVFSGWMSKKAKETVKQYEQGISDGTLHAEWKDEEWQRNHPPDKRVSIDELDLVKLVKASLLRIGDVIVYRRHFPSTGICVEKDLLVWSIHEKPLAINFILQPGQTSPLPAELLVVSPPYPRPPLLTMEGIMSSLELEGAILDVHGGVKKSELFTANTVTTVNFWGDVSPDVVTANRAAKSLSIWRWREETKNDLELQIVSDRGGRELLGTVFHLRRA